MRKILETLRLREQLGFNTRQIAEVIKASPTTVSDYLRRAEMAGVDYATGLQMGHEWLELRLGQTAPNGPRRTAEYSFPCRPGYS